MLDERLKTRNESCSTSSPTLRHSREGGNLPRTTSRKSSSWRSAGPIGSIMHLSSLSLSKGLFLISLLFLAACTDYVQQMDDGFDEWEQAQKQKILSSSSKTEMSSSSVKLSKSSSSVILSSDSHEKSSSSTEKKNSSSSNNKASSSSAKSSSSNKVSSSSEQKNKSSSSLKASSSPSKVTSSSSTTKLSSSSAKAVSSSSSKIDENTSSSEKSRVSSSSEKASSSSISYGVLIDERDGQTYKTIAIGSQVWLAENLNYEIDGSYCYENSDNKCAKYGRLYKLTAAKNACPDGWHLPIDSEFETLISIAGEKSTAAKNLKSLRGWNNNGNGLNTFGFSALPAGELIIQGLSRNYGSEGNDAFFWSASEDVAGAGHYMYLYYNDDLGLSRIADMYAFSVRCLKGASLSSSSSENLLSSSSSKASWTYLNPAISYGEIVDDRDGQVYKTVVIDSKTWMAENLNYESVKSYCYENKKDSCSKYGRLYIWSAAMDSVGAFTTNSKGCGYPNECHTTKNPVRGVCPEKWHLPSQQEWYDLSTYNSSTIRGELSSAGERLKSANGWFNSGNGDNTYGFSVLPAGTGSEENYSRSGEKTCFWSSSDGNGIDAYGIHFEYSNSKGVLQGTMKSAGCSIRCVKD